LNNIKFGRINGRKNVVTLQIPDQEQIFPRTNKTDLWSGFQFEEQYLLFIVITYVLDFLIYTSPITHIGYLGILYNPEHDT
jgi:hypothetical protein